MIITKYDVRLINVTFLFVNYPNVVPYADVRLVKGDGNSYGLVEVNFRNIWGTICQEGFDMSAADVVCKQLGFLRGAINFYGNAVYGLGNGTIWLSNVKCNGSESNIAQCNHYYWGLSDCTHDQDVSIVCNTGIVMISLQYVLQNMH